MSNVPDMRDQLKSKLFAVTVLGDRAIHKKKKPRRRMKQWLAILAVIIFVMWLQQL